MNHHDPQGRAMDRLLQQDRIVSEARMLPKDRKLSKGEVESVREKLRELMARTADAPSPVTLGLVAKQTAYAASTLSQWLGEKYRGDVDAVTHTVNLWIERYARRETMRGNRVYIETWVCEQMMAIARFAHRRERMAAIVAPSGAGKDMVIDILAEELGGFVVKCHKKMTSRELLLELANKLAIGGRKAGSAASLIRRINEALRDKATAIFLNEAQQLSGDCASVIRAIYDDTHVPFLMFGAKSIFEFIDDRASGDGQFWRRCIKCNIVSKMAGEVDPDTGHQGRRLFSRDEIRRFVAMKQVRLVAGDGAFEMLHAIACLVGHGTLGLMEAVIEGILDLNGNDVAVSRDLIVQHLYLEMEDEARGVIDQAEQIVEEDAPRAMTA